LEDTGLIKHKLPTSLVDLDFGEEELVMNFAYGHVILIVVKK